MANERNALEELAEFLREDSEMPSKNFEKQAIESLGIDGYERFIARKRKYAKAARIVAELAKADSIYAADPVTNNCVKLQIEAFKNCRAIAAEGEVNGKH